MRPPCTAILLLGVAACSGPRHTPLVQAARSGDAEAVRTLLGQGADPDEPAGYNGWTPLLHAIHKAQRRTVVALLDGGADPNRSSPSGLTPLIMAAGYGDTETVVILLGRGADPRAKTRNGATALSRAVGGVSDIDKCTVGRCQTDTVRALLRHTPDLRLEDPWARRFARWGGCDEVLRLVDPPAVAAVSR